MGRLGGRIGRHYNNLKLTDWAKIAKEGFEKYKNKVGKIGSDHEPEPTEEIVENNVVEEVPSDSSQHEQKVEIEVDEKEVANPTNTEQTTSSNSNDEVQVEINKEEIKTENKINEDKTEELNRQKEKFEKDKEDAKNKFENKISKINEGPPAILNFFTSSKFFWLTAAFDSLMTFPGGFIISSIINFILYSIPLMMLGRIGLFLLVFLFYTFDAGVSFVLEFLSLTGLGFVFSIGLDLIPEIIASAIGLAPYQLVNGAVDSYQAKRLRRAKEKFAKQEKNIEKNNQLAIKKINQKYAERRERVKKMFTSLIPSGGVSLSTQRIFSIIVLLVTAFFSWIGIIGVEPIKNFNLAGIFFTALFLIILLLLQKINLFSDNFLSLIIVMVLSWALRFLLKTHPLSFLGPYSLIYTLMAFLAIVIYVLYSFDLYDEQTMIILYLLFALIISSPVIYGYFSSDRWHDDWNKKITEAKAESKNIDWVGLFKSYIKQQAGIGSGEYIQNGETEQTHEYVGVKIEDISPLKSYFYTDEPVVVEVDYSANSLFPLTVFTSCKIDGLGPGVVTEPRLRVSKARPTRTECTFENLPKGNYVVDVFSSNNFRSTVRVPLKFMDSKFIESILLMAKDSSKPISPESFVGGTQKPLTTAGPIKTGVSNSVENGVNKLKMPIEVTEEGLSSHVSRIKFQLQNEEVISGKITSIKSMEFNLPEGLRLTNCDFIKNTTSLDPIVSEGRWIINIEDGFQNWENLQTISCNLKIDPAYADDLIPPLMHWSPQTMFMTINYQYLQKKSTSIEVKA